MVSSSNITKKSLGHEPNLSPSKNSCVISSPNIILAKFSRYTVVIVVLLIDNNRFVGNDTLHYFFAFLFTIDNFLIIPICSCRSTDLTHRIWFKVIRG